MLSAVRWSLASGPKNSIRNLCIGKSLDFRQKLIVAFFYLVPTWEIFFQTCTNSEFLSDESESIWPTVLPAVPKFQIFCGSDYRRKTSETFIQQSNCVTVPFILSRALPIGCSQSRRPSQWNAWVIRFGTRWSLIRINCHLCSFTLPFFRVAKFGICWSEQKERKKN